jgi:hypothetical protein
MMLFKTLEAFS